MSLDVIVKPIADRTKVSPSENDALRGFTSCLDRGVDAALGRVEREDVVGSVIVQRGVRSRQT